MASMAVAPMRTSFTWLALTRFLISLYETLLARAGDRNWFRSTSARNSSSSGASEKRGGRMPPPGLALRSVAVLRRSLGKLGSAMRARGANSGPCPAARATTKNRPPRAAGAGPGGRAATPPQRVRGSEYDAPTVTPRGLVSTPNWMNTFWLMPNMAPASRFTWPPDFSGFSTQ